MIALLLCTLLAQTNVRVTGAMPNGRISISRENNSSGALSLIGQPLITAGQVDVTLKSNSGIFSLTRYLVTFPGGVERWQIPASPLSTTRNIVRQAIVVSPVPLFVFVTETPSGLVNGINRVFVLSRSPANNSLIVFFNGLAYSENIDYTIIGPVITMNVAPEPASLLRVRYVEN